MELKHYAEILIAGVTVPNPHEVPLRSRDETPDLKGGAFGYRVFDRWVSKAPDGSEMRGDKANFSGWMLYGREMTLGEVEREMPEAQILIDNMRGNGHDRVVKCRQGFVPMYAGDRVVGPDPAIEDEPTAPRP